MPIWQVGFSATQRLVALAMMLERTDDRPGDRQSDCSKLWNCLVREASRATHEAAAVVRPLWQADWLGMALLQPVPASDAA